MEKQLYQFGGGWGYRIKVNGKVFIEQPFTPCLQGNVPMSKEVAENISDIVIDKLRDNPHTFPALTVDEVRN